MRRAFQGSLIRDQPTISSSSRLPNHNSTPSRSDIKGGLGGTASTGIGPPAGSPLQRMVVDSLYIILLFRINYSIHPRQVPRALSPQRWNTWSTSPPSTRMTMQLKKNSGCSLFRRNFALKSPFRCWSSTPIGRGSTFTWTPHSLGSSTSDSLTFRVMLIYSFFKILFHLFYYSNPQTRFRRRFRWPWHLSGASCLSCRPTTIRMKIKLISSGKLYYYLSLF